MSVGSPAARPATPLSCATKREKRESRPSTSAVLIDGGTANWRRDRRASEKHSCLGARLEPSSTLGSDHSSASGRSVGIPVTYLWLHVPVFSHPRPSISSRPAGPHRAAGGLKKSTRHHQRDRRATAGTTHHDHQPFHVRTLTLPLLVANRRFIVIWLPLREAPAPDRLIEAVSSARKASRSVPTCLSRPRAVENWTTELVLRR